MPFPRSINYLGDEDLGVRVLWGWDLEIELFWIYLDCRVSQLVEDNN